MQVYKARQAAASALLLAALWIAGATSAMAAMDDYEFRLEEETVRQGEVDIAVRLLDRRSGASIPDAVIFATRVDMAPDGMAAMTAPVEQTNSAEPGVYRFRTTLAMRGNWRLSLAAKIQGEVGTLESRLVVRAAP
jgi:hypothetical protein